MHDGKVFLDSFSAGLDDLNRQQQADPVAVLKVLHRTGKFSVFEATATTTLANMMTALFDQKLVEDTRKGKDTYPWTYVRLTEAGLHLIAK